MIWQRPHFLLTKICNNVMTQNICCRDPFERLERTLSIDHMSFYNQIRVFKIRAAYVKNHQGSTFRLCVRWVDTRRAICLFFFGHRDTNNEPIIYCVRAYFSDTYIRLFNRNVQLYRYRAWRHIAASLPYEK